MSAMTHSPDSNASDTALPSDRDLLRRFIFDGDEASFAAIVERHATLVVSVCRRVVGQSQDVDDAFQATFFALAQRPASIHECRSLTGWLYSVAWRTSVRLVRLRKRTMTQPLPDQVPASEPDPLDVIAQASDLASLDEELNQLPQKYRDVLVMSYFAQQTNQEIADQLNESKGAVDGRIRDARRMLRVRLARRGVEVGVLAVATAYVQSSASAATPILIQKAISLGAPGIVSQELAALNAADVAHMKLLTSTGIPLMSKIGLTIAAGLILATGVWGMSHLAAFQDAGEGGGAANPTAAEENQGVPDLKGRTEVAADEAPAGSEVTLSSNAAEANVSADGTTSSNPGGGLLPLKSPTAKPRRPLKGAVAEFSRQSARDVDERLNEIIQSKPVKSLSFPGENPLTDILEQISGHATNTYCVGDQRFTIMPDLQALDADSVVLRDVMIKDIEFDGIALSSALDLILSQTDPSLTWVVKDEVVLITTVSAAESDEYLFLRSYDISQLREISKLSVSIWDTSVGQNNSGGGGSFQSGGLQGGGLGGGGAAQATQANSLINKPENPTPAPPVSRLLTWEASLIAIVDAMSSPPCRWFDTQGEGGRMNVAGNRLLVRQSRKGHEQVVAVLEQLEMAADDAAEEQ